MKKIFLIILIIAIYNVPCLLNAEMDIGKYDGNEWQMWDSTKKYHYISGVIGGVAYIIENNFSANNILPEKDYDAKKAFLLRYPEFDKSKAKKKTIYTRKEVDMVLEYDRLSRNSTLLNHAITGITNGQIVEGLNQLYSDFKNRQINLREAIYVVKKQIKGASDEEIQTILEWLRTNSNERDFSKLYYKDKMGETKWAVFP